MRAKRTRLGGEWRLGRKGGRGGGEGEGERVGEEDRSPDKKPALPCPPPPCSPQHPQAAAHAGREAGLNDQRLTVSFLLFSSYPPGVVWTWPPRSPTVVGHAFTSPTFLLSWDTIRQGTLQTCSGSPTMIQQIQDPSPTITKCQYVTLQRLFQA